MKAKRAIISAVVLLAGFFAPASVPASTNQPYIDGLLSELDQEVGAPNQSPTSFIEDERRAIDARSAAHDSVTESFIEKEQASDPSLRGSSNASESYTERERAKLDPPPANPSAIQSFKDGTDELKMKRPGKIHFAGGFRISPSTTRTYSGGGGSLTYNQLYGDANFPDITLFFEWQPWHSEVLGNVGLVTTVSYSQARAPGVLGASLLQRWDGANGAAFSTTSSSTYLTFVVVPVSLGANFRLNSLRVVRPYVQAMGTSFFYMEHRNDGGKAVKSYSTGYTLSGGLNIPLDWISDDTNWEAYEESGIKKFYLTLDYTRQATISARPMEIASTAFSLGFTYEF